MFEFENEGDSVTIYDTGREELDGKKGIVGVFVNGFGEKNKGWLITLNESGKTVKVHAENIKANVICFYIFFKFLESKSDHAANLFRTKRGRRPNGVSGIKLVVN